MTCKIVSITYNSTKVNYTYISRVNVFKVDEALLML